MVNSRLGLFSAASSRSSSAAFTIPRHPFSRSYGVILPSSLTRVLSRALGFSPRLPVSVCGTGTWLPSLEAFLGSVGSVTSLLLFAPLHLSGFMCGGFAYRTPYRLGPAFPTAGLTYPPASLHPQAVPGGIGFSTDFPSPTPCGLGLGPGLLWADEPSPEILRLSAGRILTCLFAYSYRHSHFLPLHRSLRYDFYGIRTLPYHLRSEM